MNQRERDQKEQEIKAKCDAAGCNKERRAVHFAMYVNEQWDVHPPLEFKNFVLKRWEKEELEDEESCRKTGRKWHPTERPNPITLWNSDRERQEYFKSRGRAINRQEQEDIPF